MGDDRRDYPTAGARVGRLVERGRGAELVGGGSHHPSPRSHSCRRCVPADAAAGARSIPLLIGGNGGQVRRLVGAHGRRREPPRNRANARRRRRARSRLEAPRSMAAWKSSARRHRRRGRPSSTPHAVHGGHRQSGPRRRAGRAAHPGRARPTFWALPTCWSARSTSWRPRSCSTSNDGGTLVVVGPSVCAPRSR